MTELRDRAEIERLELDIEGDDADSAADEPEERDTAE